RRDGRREGRPVLVLVRGQSRRCCPSLRDEPGGDPSDPSGGGWALVLGHLSSARLPRAPGFPWCSTPRMTGLSCALKFCHCRRGGPLAHRCRGQRSGERCAMPKVLVLTNDFPPRPGGIQFFVHALATRLPPGSVTVYAPAWQGAEQFDAELPFPVVRHPTSLMLPVPSVARRAERIIEREGCDTVLFGAAAPLGLLAPRLRRAGALRLVAVTHGHEVGWAALPAARAMLRRIGDSVDTVTYLGDYTRVRLARALSPAAVARMTRLTPGVDTSEFYPGAGGQV